MKEDEGLLWLVHVCQSYQQQPEVVASTSNTSLLIEKTWLCIVFIFTTRQEPTRSILGTGQRKDTRTEGASTAIRARRIAYNRNKDKLFQIIRKQCTFYVSTVSLPPLGEFLRIAHLPSTGSLPSDCHIMTVTDTSIRTLWYIFYVIHTTPF